MNLDGCGDEQRYEEIETIVFQTGCLTLFSGHGYFCKVSKDGICVEDFGPSKRSALKYARRAWRKERGKQKTLAAYPKVVPCEEV